MTEERRIAHEIRNGLNALHLNAVCLKLCEPDEAIDCVDAIIQACDELIQLMEQMEQLPEKDV